MSEWADFPQDARSMAKARGPKCQVSGLLKLLPRADAKEVEHALADETITSAGIFRAIRSRMGDSPWAPSLWSVANHRRGNCACRRNS